MNLNTLHTNQNGQHTIWESCTRIWNLQWDHYSWFELGKRKVAERDGERERGGVTEKRQKFRPAYKQKVKSFVKSLQRLGLSQWIWPGFATTVNNIWPKKKVKPRGGVGNGHTNSLHNTFYCPTNWETDWLGDWRTDGLMDCRLTVSIWTEYAK